MDYPIVAGQRETQALSTQTSPLIQQKTKKAVIPCAAKGPKHGVA